MLKKVGIDAKHLIQNMPDKTLKKFYERACGEYVKTPHNDSLGLWNGLCRMIEDEVHIHRRKMIKDSPVEETYNLFRS